MRACIALLLLATLLSGCPANFIEAYEVAEPRLMGVRVEVEADGGGDDPRPTLAQTFDLRQYLALPGPWPTPLANRYAMALSVCLGFETPTGSLTCIGEQQLTPTLTPISDTELLLSGLKFDASAVDFSKLDLPAGLAGLDPNTLASLADLDRLSLFGVFCVDGTPTRVPGKSVTTDPPSAVFRCTNNASAQFPDATTFTLSVFLDRGMPGDANHNPSFACDMAAPDSPCAVGVARTDEPKVGGAIVLVSPQPKAKGQLRAVTPWLPSPDPNALPIQGCASNPKLLQVRGGEDEYVVRLRFDPSDREMYQAQVEFNGQSTTRDLRESLDLTSALTYRGGKLGEFESLLLGTESDGDAEISVSYKPPKQSDDPQENIPQNGRLVRFYFTLRDQRGGVDYTMRELCLVPPAMSSPTE